MPTLTAPLRPSAPHADRFHCFFSDSAFASADAWQAAVRIQDGVRTFDSPDHRKIR